MAAGSINIPAEKKLMSTPMPHEVTQLLLAWSEGDQSAIDRLIPLVYSELHRLAQSYMRREQAGQRLQCGATSLTLPDRGQHK